jgi:hypothetical protein
VLNVLPHSGQATLLVFAPEIGSSIDDGTPGFCWGGIFSPHTGLVLLMLLSHKL